MDAFFAFLRRAAAATAKAFKKTLRFLRQHPRQVLALIRILCVLIIVVNLWQLASYGIDFVRSRIAVREMRDANREAETLSQSEEVGTTAELSPEEMSLVPEALSLSDLPEALVAVESFDEENEEDAALPLVETSTDVVVDAKEAEFAAAWRRPYPSNPFAKISPRFKKLRQRNSDLIGWLKVDGMFDHAVMQRDNTYYLRRDSLGYHNTNGTLFLDARCRLDRQPLLYILYGHNMKNGEMFGSLRDWENRNFYHNNPFITFDTMYEEGEFVIFSVGTVSVSTLISGITLYDLVGSSAAYEQYASFIRSLQYGSVYTRDIDVTTDDQILLLVTCTADDNERRIIAARRIREGESKSALQSIVEKIRKK